MHFLFLKIKFFMYITPPTSEVFKYQLTRARVVGTNVRIVRLRVGRTGNYGGRDLNIYIQDFIISALSTAYEETQQQNMHCFLADRFLITCLFVWQNNTLSPTQYNFGQT